MQDKLVVNPKNQVWLKSWGESDNRIKKSEVFSTDEMNFARKPASLRVGDLLVVYAVGWGNVLAVMEAIGSPELTEPGSRWPYSVKVKNLAPKLGNNWFKNGLVLYTMRDDFDAVSSAGVSHHGSSDLRSLQNGHLLVSRAFAEFVFTKINDILP